MEEHEMLDNPKKTLLKKELWTTRFLATSLISIALITAVSQLNSAFQVPYQYLSYLIPLLHLIAIVSALAGFVMGFTERNYNKKKSLVGILGNGLILGFYIFLGLVAYFSVLRLY